MTAKSDGERVEENDGFHGKHAVKGGECETTSGRDVARERTPGGQKPMPVGKNPSGKASGYMKWLREQGRGLFIECRGVRYDEQNPDHKALMTQLWMEVPAEQKFALKEWERNENKDRSKYLQNRNDAAKKRRALQHADPALHAQRQRAHNQSLIAQKAVGTGSITSVEVRPLHTTEDLEAFCKMNAERAHTVLRSIMNQPFAPSEDMRHRLWDPCYQIQFVSVSPLSYVYKYRLNKMVSYPAEISITNFHLKTGIQHTETFFVHFDSNWLYHRGKFDQCDADNRDLYSAKTGIPATGPVGNNVLSPSEALHWMVSRFNENPGLRIVCDQNQFNFVFYALKMLSVYTGHQAKCYFLHKLSGQLLGIQDYLDILLCELPHASLGRWSKQEIDKAFKNHQLIPLSDQARICETHSAMRSHCKYNCTGAHSARILHTFFRILREHRLVNISEYCDTPAHRSCAEVFDHELPEILIAPTISRAEELKYKNLLLAERHDTNTNTADAPPPQDAEQDRVCEEPTYRGEDGSDSDTEEEEEVYRGPYRPDGNSDDDSDEDGDPDQYPSSSSRIGSHQRRTTNTESNHFFESSGPAGHHDVPISASRFDEDDLRPRGNNDLAAEQPAAAEPIPQPNEVPPTPMQNVINNPSGAYADSEMEYYCEIPELDCIFDPDESRYYIDRLRDPKEYKLIDLSGFIFAGVTYYCMTKSAVDQFTKCLALEMAPNGVRVNAVCPGVIVTNIHRASGQDEATYAEFLEKCKTTHVLGRAGTTSEVAEAILFLASEKSSFTTGELLRVDGGRGIMHPR
uniref:Uncharacterized protein n=1 Tax=Caenorhabditis japonica TaxID=281687 RepID=A0A8R1DSH6_CAEJA